MLTLSLIALLVIAAGLAGFLAGVKHGKRFTALKEAIDASKFKG